VIKKYWPIILTWGAVLLLYYPFLSVYFTGDDFFHFKVSMTDGSFTGFIKLFGFYSFEERGIAFYRPLFREILYNIYYSFFGLDAFPFRITQLTIHFVNISLVFVFFQKLFKRKSLSAFVTFFYGITAAQVGSLYYLAGGIQAQGATMFMLLALISYMKHLSISNPWSWKSRYWMGSFGFFVLGLMSHELAIVTLPLLIGLEWISDKNVRDVRVFVGKIARNLWPFGVITLAYLYLNFFVIGFSGGEVQYQPSLSPSRAANTLMWYTVWAIGLPEMLVDFIAPGFRLLPNLMQYWGNYFSVIFPMFIGSMGVVGGIGAYLLIKKREVFQDKRFWFLIIWFPLALLPVIFLPLHKKTYYLATALPAFLGIVGYLVFSFYESLAKKRKTFGKVVIGLLFLLLFILSSASIRLSDETYWAAKRGRLAEKLITGIKSEYPELPKGATLLIRNDPNYPSISGDWGGASTQANYILNGSDALQLIYDDFELEVYYEDLGEYAEGEAYVFVAVID